MIPQKKVLVVDDDQNLGLVLKHILEKEALQVDNAYTACQALDYFQTCPYSAVLEDIKLPDGNGFDLLRTFQELNAKTPVVVLTALSNWETAVEAMRLGAFSYIQKPFNNLDVIETLQRATLQKEILEHTPPEDPHKFIIGNSPPMKRVYETIRKIAASDTTVLIEGESGTGKEIVARTIHRLSSRADQPFIAVNCGAFTETLLDSELFGHKKGAFTGAIADKRGLFEMAHQGTLFLDEVSDMSPLTQVRLLRVLETREFTPLGAEKPQRVNVRILAATNKKLEEAVLKGTFRQDLYYRLNVIPIQLPPLRERFEDIILLAGFFLNKYNQKLHKNITGFAPKTLDMLYAYPWTGNVRELENTIQRTIALAGGPLIEPEDLGLKTQEPIIPQSGISLEEELNHLEKSYLLKALAITRGNMTEAAGLLGLSFRTFRYKVQKYHLGKGQEPVDSQPSGVAKS